MGPAVRQGGGAGASRGACRQKSRRGRALAAGALVVLGLWIGGCGAERDGAVLRLGDRVAVKGAQVRTAEAGAFRFAVAPVITPREDLASFRPLFEYLGARLGRPVKHIQTQTYAEINELVKFGGVDAALVCTYAYTVGQEDAGLELLAVPQIRGKTTYRSVIVVPADSPARSLEDLEGKRFAFTDPLSFSGRLAVTYMLWEKGHTPEDFFSRYIFTYSHDGSLRAVLGRVVDGAAIDSVIFDAWRERHPRDAGRVKVIGASQEVGILPVVVRRGLAPELKDALRAALLQAHLDPRGREALRKLGVDRFVPADDRAYDPIRRMVAEMKRVSR